ncbi:MAG: DUF6691 family protein [Gammaproteobacteria bacterium]
MNGRNPSQALVGLIAGIVFGLGLAISEMTNPTKILAFLNVLGDWDPSLLLVMGSALIVTWVGYRTRPGSAPLLDTSYHLPTATKLDRSLLTGAAIFGLGWGLGGYCPGPAIASLGSAKPQVYLFITALLIGGLLPGLFSGRKSAD